MLEGRDVLASAQTGTGKTAGFTLPVLSMIGEEPNKRKKRIKVLVLTPTRELAAQVQESFDDYSSKMHFKSCVIFGGVKQNPQVEKIKSGVDAVIATPGRLLDLNGQGLLSLSDVEVFVLDEADRMLDMGFIHDIKRIIKLMPEDRQNLLFSATFNKEIKALAKTFLNDPVLVEATPENSTAETVQQSFIRIDRGLKTAMTIKLITDGDWHQVLVFTRTKYGANKLSKKLEKAKISSAAIHGDKSQNQRTRALAGFKDGSIRVLVATDIAARGLDIPQLPHVINYEIPNVAEDYVHRIGRTGRAGEEGEAISLVSADEVAYIKGIEKLLGKTIKTKEVVGFEPTEVVEEKKKPKNNNWRRSKNKNYQKSNSKNRKRK